MEPIAGTGMRRQGRRASTWHLVAAAALCTAPCALRCERAAGHALCAGAAAAAARTSMSTQQKHPHLALGLAALAALSLDLVHHIQALDDLAKHNVAATNGGTQQASEGCCRHQQREQQGTALAIIVVLGAHLRRSRPVCQMRL